MPTSAELLRAALASQRAGELAQAAALYRDLLDQEPRSVDALHMLGMVEHQLGHDGEALERLAEALDIAPGHAGVLANRAAIHLAAGAPDRAEADARAAIAADAGTFGAWFNLGLALEGRGVGTSAVHALRRASALRPQQAGALLRWLRAAGREGQPAGVAARLRAPLPSLAGHFEMALDAASALENGGQSSAAWALLARLRSERPQDAALAARWDVAMRYRHACELESDRRSDAAMATAAQVLAFSPSHRGARLLRAELARERGEIDSALDEYAQLLAAHPHDAVAASSQLIALQHAPAATADAIADAHRAWAHRHAQPVAPRWKPTDGDADRPLRIGWLSPRFSSGVVGTFFAAAFEALDRARMHHVLYDNGSVEDAINARFRAAAGARHRVDDLDDEELCERIRADRIDVLVELSGHGPGNRLRALSARPAPVQVSWLDYFHSTGSDAIDFFISDTQSSPPASAPHYSETVLYLPSGRLCYAPSIELPSPIARNASPLRFACFNRLAKLNDAVLATWARILGDHPRSVLRLKAGALDDAQMRARFIARAERHGIAAARLELAGYGTHADVLAAYADVDIALDPFPFSGCATSCDALVMGVPVVTLAGATMASRQTASLLASIGLDDCIAHDRGDYVGRVRALVDDASRRSQLRAELPAHARAAFGDVLRHAHELGVALREAWVRSMSA